jgi:hypothetical protein
MLMKLTQGEIELVKWVFELNGVVIVERHFHHPSSEFVPEKLKKENKIQIQKNFQLKDDSTKSDLEKLKQELEKTKTDLEKLKTDLQKDKVKSKK